jgi:hypothetical protein
MRTQRQQPAAMILEPAPAFQTNRLRLCIFCQQALSDSWIRISRTGRDGYSIAAHPDCLAKRKPAV